MKAFPFFSLFSLGVFLSEREKCEWVGIGGSWRGVRCPEERGRGRYDITVGECSVSTEWVRE